MRWVFLLPLSLLYGCAIEPDTSYTADIDPAFSQEQTDAILSAIHQWESATDGRLTITSITHGACVELGQTIGNNPGDNQVCYVAKSSEWIKSTVKEAFPNSNPDATLAYTQLWPMSNHANVFLPIVGLDNAVFATVSLHETGHSYGLLHETFGVMCYDTGCMSTTLQCSDLAQWAAIRGVSDKSKSCPTGGTYTLSGKE
jgi:hypothetical protein